MIVKSAVESDLVTSLHVVLLEKRTFKGLFRVENIHIEKIYRGKFRQLGEKNHYSKARIFLLQTCSKDGSAGLRCRGKGTRTGAIGLSTQYGIQSFIRILMNEIRLVADCSGY